MNLVDISLIFCIWVYSSESELLILGQKCTQVQAKSV